MAKGTIARLMDRGFGFIKTEEGGDLFFHRNELEGVELRRAALCGGNYRSTQSG